MKELQERIKKDGNAINEDILKVDSFINHQVDPELMAHIGEEFANHFKDCGITKIATIESSGIAPALMTAQCMGLPLIILKKQPSKVLNDHLFQTEVTSFTKGTSYELTLSSKFISENDRCTRSLMTSLRTERQQQVQFAFFAKHMLQLGESEFSLKNHFSRDMRNLFLRDLMYIRLHESVILLQMKLSSSMNNEKRTDKFVGSFLSLFTAHPIHHPHLHSHNLLRNK